MFSLVIWLTRLLLLIFLIPLLLLAYSCHAVVPSTVTLPSYSVATEHIIGYSPAASTVQHVVVYTVNTSATDIDIGTPSSWSWAIKVLPYVNNTGYITPDSMAVLLGTLQSGDVANLTSFDNVSIVIQSYNESNTMKITVTLNITTLGWLTADPTLLIDEIEVIVAGSLSKTVNTKASLEILDWSTGQWTVIDAAALNQTSNTQKRYLLSQVLGSNLSRFISSSGVIAFRINITDAQTYPSTYVNLSLDQLVVKVVYKNETSAVVKSWFIILVPYKPAVLKNVTIAVRANGTGSTRTVSLTVLADNAVVLSVENLTYSTSWTENVFILNATVSSNITVVIEVNLTSSLTQSEEVDIAYVVLYLDNVSWAVPTCRLVNASTIPCSADLTVQLTNTSAVNRSVLKLYVIANLTFVNTTYPTTPVYASHVLVSNRTYSVYVIVEKLR